jgi:5-bromo-4-chloroindolyl phosphate hydrolysis protein
MADKFNSENIIRFVGQKSNELAKSIKEQNLSIDEVSRKILSDYYDLLQWAVIHSYNQIDNVITEIDKAKQYRSF